MINIKVPTLLIDKDKCRNNIKLMSEKAQKHNLHFRPHFKTHQSAEIGKWYKEFGVKAITVSSVKMAKYFAANGWTDITIAFPFNWLEIDDVNELAKTVSLNITVAASETAFFLAENINTSIGIFIKIDTGYNRSGILADDSLEIEKTISNIRKNSNLKFKGWLAHYGHTYKTRKNDEILHIHQTSIKQLVKLKSEYKLQFPEHIISIGDTPSCSVLNDFSGADEIRPGNFVFYDVTQFVIGSCTAEKIAVAMACPVVYKSKERNEIVIYGGGVHFSKDHVIDISGKIIFGLPVFVHQNNWSEPIKNCYVKSFSQEHGVIVVDEQTFHSIQIGSVIGILPAHSCLTADLMKNYYTFDGEKIDMLK